MVNNMCDRTVKMKLKKNTILSDVNSNTNSIELTVKGSYNKSFAYKKQSHVNTQNYSHTCLMDQDNDNDK